MVKNSILNFIYDMKTAYFVLIISLILYLVFLDEEGAFTKKFMHFGPSEDATFIKMKINTWPKVITVYIIGFVTSLLIYYYNAVADNFIHQYLWNPAYKGVIPMTKNWVILITMVDQLIYPILEVLQFFVNMTVRVQFIIPNILGRLVIGIPNVLYMINKKKFIQ